MATISQAIADQITAKIAEADNMKVQLQSYIDQYQQQFDDQSAWRDGLQAWLDEATIA